MTASARSTPPPRRSRRRRRLLLVCALLCGAGLFYWYRVHRPQVMLAQAKSAALRSPAEAEQIVAAAIAQSVGSFPAAQLYHAQLLEGLGRTDEALGQFSLIDAPQQLPAKDLSDLARIAMSRSDQQQPVEEERRESIGHSASLSRSVAWNDVETHRLARRLLH